MYKRKTQQFVQSSLESQAAVVLLGPRQVGKTTLALDIASERPSVYLDLEREADRQILTEPDLYLDEQAGKLVILDDCLDDRLRDRDRRRPLLRLGLHG